MEFFTRALVAMFLPRVRFSIAPSHRPLASEVLSPLSIINKRGVGHLAQNNA